MSLVNGFENMLQLDGNISFDESILDVSSDINIIPVIINNRPEKILTKSDRGSNLRNLVTLRRNNKLVEASRLPVVVNLNPRSLYNKKDEFRILIEQSEASICCISETWDRSQSEDGQLISDVLQIEGFRWIKNPVQRNRRGGKPAILASEKDYHITELCPNIVTVPIDVEVVWALLTPKNHSNFERFRHIVVAAFYYSSTQTKRADFIDHICETYHILCTKYGQNLAFILAGDANRLNLKPILSLSPDLRQVVAVPTRRNPDAILDVIVTNAHKLYQSPYTLQPLDNDENQNGEPSDHCIVIMRPLTNYNTETAKRCRIIKYRPIPESGILELGRWIQSQSWQEIYTTVCPARKALIFEQILMAKVEELFPIKTLKLDKHDKPWVDNQLLSIDRRRKREYNKNKKSEKWKYLNELFVQRERMLKHSYNEKIVEDLKISNVSQWYSKLKRMSGMESINEDRVTVEELADLPSHEQVELIADNFAKISNLYQPLKDEDIDIPCFEDSKPHPLFQPHEIHKKIQKMKKKASNVPGDVPWKIIREFSVELAEPLSNIFNSATLAGIWPDHWKHEYVTPVPKVYPPRTTDDLRKISGTKNFSKIYEALLSSYIVEDIASSVDPSQYGNRKGLSTTHYLINMVNQILTILDTNNEKEKFAVVAQLIDWSKAFDRQDPKLGVENFIKSGVRPTLIPTLKSFFQKRSMSVKWHDFISEPRDLPGGVPQGSTFGVLEFDVSSDTNADHIEEKMKYKFVDDLSTLEKLNLLAIGLSSYNFKAHVASDIGIDQKYLPPENFGGQESLDIIQKWTKDNKAVLNTEKTKVMVFNFTKEHQFSTRLYLEGQLLETITETKLLGTIVTSDLKWHRNSDMLVRKAYQRMRMIQNLKSFGVNIEDLRTIYILYIRSILEQNCQVWHYSLTNEDETNFERVQKVACYLILHESYESYEKALTVLNLETLKIRREKLCLKFARKCIKHPKASEMFPLNSESSYNFRTKEKYVVQKAKTDRLMYSAIPQLQRILNLDHQKKK